MNHSLLGWRIDGSWSHSGLHGAQQAASRTTWHPLALNAPSTRIGVWSFLFGPPVSVSARRPRRLATMSPWRRLVAFVWIVSRWWGRQAGLCRRDCSRPAMRTLHRLGDSTRWSSSQTTRHPQAQSQLHLTWHTKYDAEQVCPLTCCVQPERSSVQVNQVEFRSCLAKQTKR